jgi:hypothetical protein
MGWLNDCVTTSVTGASSPRMYIVGTKRKSRGEGEGKLAGSSGLLSKAEWGKALGGESVPVCQSGWEGSGREEPPWPWSCGQQGC